MREAKTITQEELANKVGVTARTIISLEKGQYKPSIMLAYKLSLFF
ncbi:helix-turn-helix transcriptional regulator [Peptostreptococcus sp. D1]|nr:helix-turn-helix domain-containing protein [Peptostreptococcus sp. D1]